MLAIALAMLSQTLPLDGPGPHGVGEEQARSLVLDASRTVTADLYWPTNAVLPSPVVVVGHGFARSRTQLTHWGEHLASWGFVVLVPSFPSPFLPDHEANALIMRDLIPHLRANPGPVTAAIDPLKSAVIGHSAGGLSAILAAAQDPTITVLVGLDPVDNAGRGVAAAPMVSQPALVLAAAPSLCNSNGSASALYGALSVGARWFLRVTGSTHCDGEDPSDGICALNCGGQDAARRALHRRYATAHLLGYLFCTGTEALPGGAVLTQDLSAGLVGDLATGTGGPSCGSPDAGPSDAQPADAPGADTGPPGDAAGDAAPPDAAPDEAGVGDAAPLDATPAPDAAPAQDAALPPDLGIRADAGPARDAAAGADAGVLVEVEDSDCSCRATAKRRGGPPVLALLLLLAARRRGR